MIAVRFHGRGGQGAKTASRILGTAAFLEGFVAQDSPIYGAERRGAPVAAYTRIAKEPIRERGLIVHPDLVVVADASLISQMTPEQVHAQGFLPGRLTTLDLTDIALQQFGKRGAISALLGAVAGRFVGLRWESVYDAIGRELADLGLADAVIKQNQTAARHCYETVPAADFEAGTPHQVTTVQLRAPTYESPARGTARITAGPNSAIRSMSGWRTFRPVLRPDLCNGCWLCFANCPEGAITIKPDGKPAIYYPHCKGCLDCVEVCPTDALTVERETEATRNK